MSIHKLYLVSVVFCAIGAGSSAFAIFGGKPAPIDSAYYATAQVAGTGCTAERLGPQAFLTAGHCVSMKPTKIRINTPSPPGDRQIDCEILQMPTLYPGFESEDKYHHVDLGLIRADCGADGGGPTYLLAQKNDPVINDMNVEFRGFGDTETSSREMSWPRLLAATFKTLAFADLELPEGNVELKFLLSRPDIILSASETSYTASGDSGGPVFTFNHDDRPVIFGVQFAQIDAPGLNLSTNVTQYRDWILKTVATWK